MRILLENLLQVEVERRYGVEEVKSSKWFESTNWNEIFMKRVEPPKVTFKQTLRQDYSCDTADFSSITFPGHEVGAIDDEFSNF